MSIAFWILQDVCWALEYAHNRDFIHRDIKPANILIASNDCAKLSDFGLASRVPRGAGASPYGYLTHVAPEVFRTNRTSKLSDIYALGVTAYRLINGDGFFPEIHDQSEVQDQILSGQYPDRSRYRPYVPTKIKTVINKCMAVNPIHRFQSAALFRRALESIEIRCDWRFRRNKRNIIYLSTIGRNCIRVAILADKSGKYTIETTRQVDANPPRRVGKDCEDDMTLGQMKKRIRRILPRYVLNGK